MNLGRKFRRGFMGEGMLGAINEAHSSAGWQLRILGFAIFIAVVAAGAFLPLWLVFLVAAVLTGLLTSLSSQYRWRYRQHFEVKGAEDWALFQVPPKSFWGWVWLNFARSFRVGFSLCFSALIGRLARYGFEGLPQ